MHHRCDIPSLLPPDVYVTNYIYNWLPGSRRSRNILNKQQLISLLTISRAHRILKRETGFELFIFVNNVYMRENTVRKAALVKFTRKPVDCEQMALSVSVIRPYFYFRIPL